MTCAEVVELVTDYLEDALDASTRRRFEAHVALCRGCTGYLDQMRHTIAIAGRIEHEHLPEPLREDLRQTFHGWQGGA